MGTIKTTFDEPQTNMGDNFQSGFDKTMVKHGLPNLEEIDKSLGEADVSLKKKIFKLNKMESLVFSDPKLTAVYDEMSENGEERYGYHYNETIMNIIFNDYVLNSSKYLQKYKMAIPKEKKRRDKSGINQMKKNGDIEKRREKMRDDNAKSKKSNEDVSLFEDEDGMKGDLDSLKNKARELSKKEGVVQHVNMVSNDNYRIEDFFDANNTVASYENGNDLNETTSAGSAAGGNSSYVGYSGPSAWSPTGKPMANKPIWDGGKVIKESNYLTEVDGFEKYYNFLNEDMGEYFEGESDYDSLQGKNPPSFEEYMNDNGAELDEKAVSKSQQKLMGTVHGVQSGDIKPNDVSDKINDIAKSMKPNDVEDFASTKHNKLPEKIVKESMIDGENDNTMAMKQPVNISNGGVETGMNSTGPMGEEFDKLKNELNEFNDYVNEIEEMNEERKPSSLVLKDRLGNENSKNFKSDLKHSGTKKIIDVEKELEWEDQQIDVPKDPQKLGKDIEKNVLKVTKGDAFNNVGNSTNNDGDEIPKRNLTDEETDEVDLYRKGLGDYIYDNKPDERFEERMKRDMGDRNYELRQKRMEFNAKAPMYNKDTQPVEDGDERKQFNKEESEWNDRMGLKESMVTGKYKNELGKHKLIDFQLNESVFVNNVTTDVVEISFAGLGNAYNSKVEINEGVVSAINKYKFYTNGKSVFVLKIPTQNINESKKIKSKKRINEDFNKMKHLLNYEPKNYTNTKNIKI